MGSTVKGYKVASWWSNNSSNNMQHARWMAGTCSFASISLRSRRITNNNNNKENMRLEARSCWDDADGAN